MPPVHLALVWHQHQPIYTDPETGQPAMPWARLHAIKDYWGMARLLERSDMRLTVNLVPSLLDQIEAYAEGRAEDRHQKLGRKPASDLDESERLFVIDKFFSLNFETMVKPLTRYRELLAMRDPARRSAGDCMKLFRDREVRDLQVLFELAWFHPLLREEDHVIRALWKKGAGFTEDDKSALYDREREILSQIVPMHKGLADDGRIELTTSPYYHPILPLLVDFRALKESMPKTPLPANWRSLADDARTQVDRALRSHAERFGSPPKGIWPSEGSVSQAVAELVSEMGLEWIATDEQVLEESLGRSIGRSGKGLGRPDVLYRPYELSTGSGGDRCLKLLFRDKALSDMIGFHYRSWDGRAAAEDLLTRVRSVGRGWSGGAQPVVTVILDGENAWEFYANQGVEFFETLYSRASADPGVLPGTVSDILAKVPARPLGRVFAGSWIDRNFAIWAGHEEDRLAWEQIFRCREALDSEGLEPDHPARERLLVAEGSDWFWWYGEEFATQDLREFDRLFRSNVRSAYRLASISPPLGLEAPIARRAAAFVTPPRGLLAVRVDGKATDYFEWAAAGRAEAGARLGAMALANGPALKYVMYGVALERLYLRADFASTVPLRGSDLALRIVVLRPREEVFVVRCPADGGCASTRESNGSPAGEAVAEKLLEMAFSFAELGADVGDTVEFFVERIGTGDGGEVMERAPPEGVLSVRAPVAEDLRWDWRV